MAGDDATKNNKKNEGESIDHNSPFYLHASDYPKQMHVNEVLTDKNYSDREQEMMNFLFAKNKTGFIDGTIKKPKVESDRYLLWMRCDAMIEGKGKKDKPRPRAAMAKMKPCPILGMTKKQYAMFLKLFGENREEPVIDNMSDLEAGNLIGAGDCRDGLYWMGGTKEERKEMGFTIDAWNKRLGHASNVKLSRVSFLRDVSLSFNAKVYDSCNKEKFTRLPFLIGSIKTSNCFDLIHCDAWWKY
uniref:Retrotransposon Copia-like N-terminal domain-containing protein n=1 Tax=Tanacetum cinerariifolium TaxID=118510 RepID=A0A6L2N4W7_TANCI|nr:hypothetical protein [Tanacetum cinerariifolium]